MKQQLLLWVMVFLVGGCRGWPMELPPVTPEVIPVLTPVYSSVTLTSDNSPNLTEIVSLSDRSSSPVSSLAFSKEGRDLLVVYAGKEGFLKRWQLEERRLTTEVNLGSVGVAGTAFDSHATRLAISAGKVTPAIQAGYDTNVNGTSVWDVYSGRQIMDTGSRLPTTDTALSPDGRWLVDVASGALSIWNIDAKREELALVIGGELKPDYSRTIITAVTVDPTGTWAAFANDEGLIEIEDRRRNDTIWSAQLHDGGIPLTLAFDPIRSRLAVATTKSLTVWDLNGSLILNTPLPDSPAAGLVFSPDGVLLAVGTDGGWQIWSMSDRKLLIENKQPAYAVTFSSDNRLFAWGDTKGIIHIWGIKE